MKAVDNVDKSGLPVAAGRVELTEKDLHCVAQHLAELVNREWHHEEGVEDACQVCRFNSQCMDEETRVLDPWEAFDKLAKITGVHLCKWKNCSGKHC